jgi:hypothetical protein
MGSAMRRWSSRNSFLIALLFAAAQALAAPLPGAPACPIFPPTNVWNKDITALPVDPNSAAIINQIGPAVGFHPDFGSFLGYGIPYSIADSNTTRYNVSFQYAGESDPGPYPIPNNYLIEGGGNATNCTGDCHILIVEKNSCTLYELYAAQLSGNQWSAGSGAIWDLNSNALRPDTWTSADAAGLPILVGLARYDEVAQGVINHALRFTVQHTRNAHIYPARHDAGSSSYLPPMGMRVRVKQSVTLNCTCPQAKVILQALKTYGMILADNGSNWYISGASDPGWDDNDLRNLNNIHGSDLEVVNTTGFVNGPNPDYALGVSTATAGPVFPGQSGIFNGTLTGLNGYAANVTLSCTGAGAASLSSCNPSPASVAPGAPYAVSASANVAQDYNFNITGAGPGNPPIVHDQAVTLRVVDYDLSSSSPAAVNVVAGNYSAPVQLSVSAQGAFAGAVALSCTTATGAACLFSPSASVYPRSGAPANVTLFLVTSGTTGSGNVTINADSSTAAGPHATLTSIVALSIVAGSGAADLAMNAAQSAQTPNNINVGAPVTFTLTATASNNPGAVTANVAATFSAPVYRVVAPGCSFSSGVVQCSADISGNNSAVFAVTAYPLFTHDLTLTAVASSSASDPTPDNLAAATAQVRPRPLARH